MIFSWLPGIREVRTPVVVGLVLLTGIWLTLFPWLPSTQAEAANQFPELTSVADSIGRIGVGAAASFVAYIVGGATVEISNRALQITTIPVEGSPSGTRQALRSRVSTTHTETVNDLERRLNELVARELSDVPEGQLENARQAASVNLGHNRLWLRWRQDHSDNAGRLEPEERVRGEIKAGYVDDRILAANESLYSELSRSRSEAEFRGGLVPALVVLGIGLATVLDPIWYALILGMLAWTALLVWLVIDAQRMRTRSRDIAIRAVVDGLVTSPTIDALRSFR